MKKRPFYLIYDGECTLCENFKNAVKGMDLNSRILPISSQDPLAKKLLSHMDPETRMGNVHLVLPNGVVKSGDQAVPQILQLLPWVSPLGWLLEHLPGSRRINPLLYHFLSSQRRNFDP